MAGISNITLSIRANIEQFQNKLQKAEKRLNRFGKKMSRAGANMSQNISIPMAVAGGAALKTASDYEDAVTQIEKVSNKETASKLEKQIREMAKSIPMAQSEIAKLAADAARFGVEGAKNVENFTRTVAKMSFVTDLSAQEAGRSLAKIADQAEVPMNEIDKLGSTIVKLGDSMATSQNEIVKAMSRGTIAARNFGLQGKTIAGLAARLNEVSESGERAGTRLKRVFQELQEPKKVEAVAQALNMSAEGFRQMRKESPEKALMAVIKQIEEGGAAGKQMANIFATSSRAALRGLASDSEALEEALGKATDEFSNATAMNEQFRLESKNFSAQLQIALNKLRNMGITIGRQLMPHVMSLVETIEGLVKGFQGLSDTAQRNIVRFGAFAGAAGPLVFVIGKLLQSVGSLTRAMRVLNKVVLRNPYVALATAIATAGAALAAYLSKTEDAVEKQTALEEATKAANKQFAKNAGEAKALFDQLKFLNKGSDQYAKVIDKINSKYSKFLDNQLDEESNLKEIKAARQAVIQGLRQEARARAAQNKIQEIYNEQQKEEMKFAKQAANQTKLQKGTVLSLLDAYSKLSDETAKAVSNNQMLTKEQKKEVQQAGVNLKALQELQNANQDLAGQTGVETDQNSVLFSQLGALAGQRDINRKQVEILTERTQQSNQAQQKSAEKTKEEKRQASKLAQEKQRLLNKTESLNKAETKSFENPQIQTGLEAEQAPTIDGGRDEAERAQKLVRQRQLEEKLRIAQSRRTKQARALGNAVGNSISRTTQAISKSFTAVVMGQKKASKAFANFGKAVGSIFQRLIAQLIEMVIKMLAIKAITAVISGGGTMLGGLSGGGLGAAQGLLGGLGSGLGQAFGVGGGGGGSGRGGRTVTMRQKGDEMQSTLDFDQKKKNRAGVN